MTATLSALLNEAQDFNFFRFCELLELASPERPPLGSTDSHADDPLRFRSTGQLGFPARELGAIEYDQRHPRTPPTVRTAFLGLYGVDARLPSYFGDEIAQHRDGAEPLAAFLDLFHHRTVTQYYRVWRKYRYPVGFRADGTDPMSRYLLSLAGLGIGGGATTRALRPRSVLSMLGLVSQKTRTAEGLAGVLRHAVADAHIEVSEFYPVWIRLDPDQRLRAGGSGNPLGDACVLGRGFFDRSHAVCVVIKPDTREELNELLPGASMHGELMSILRFYLGYSAFACLALSVRRDLMPPPVLRTGQTRLGLTSVLFHRNVSGTAKRSHNVRVRIGAWNGHDISGHSI
ncbi:type VI secretion system baseplate subunit TssG [Paraburkholderia sp.]|uniref:type VI secretion system baseplate subunit TssG n=1 Tax=Paraburkholderia sp. TaxID=1926495 RepID=UPI00239BCB7E|nr:type VI secretion system baseplate subunit TssG [Paraburkholderia sp.]MDE1180315.1 type VI secretion system baseplate subunit TssG [Paraburkholderia sp.]